MITLQKLLVTESDATTGVQASKTGGDSAQDFLALLTGAMSGTGAQGQEGDAPLTLADLQAAALSGKLAKGQLSAATSGEEAQTPAQKLADLLARQSLKADATATAESNTNLQNLLSGLTPASNTDVLAALTKTAKAADEKTELSDEDLANLSALMAMLPHQQSQQLTTTQPATATSAATSAVDVGAAANRALNTRSLATDTDTDLSQTAAKGLHNAAANVQTTDDASQTAAFAAALAPRKETDNAAQQTTSTTVSMAPVTTSTSAAQASAPVAAPVISAPLGSHEWQQNLSQHVTLFTRQGQQSAELRLHPEDLGQVQISIKLEDNQAQLQMVSAHSHVRQALEAALPVLRTSLAESGIQLGQSNISSESFAGQQQQQSSQQQQASRSGSGDLLNSNDDDTLVAPASLQSAARGNGAVDIFA